MREHDHVTSNTSTPAQGYIFDVVHQIPDIIIKPTLDKGVELLVAKETVDCADPKVRDGSSMTNRTPPTISTTSPSSPHSSPSSRPTSPTRNLRRPASHGRLAQLMLPGRSRSSSSASASNQVAYADEASPASSGRTTPEQRRRTGKAAATSLLASDAKYKKFASMIDKSLASFESVNEWADFISFLSRLLKVSKPNGDSW